MISMPVCGMPGVLREEKLTIILQATDQSWESCNIYVANNPQAFVDSHWEVNYLDVYEVSGWETVQAPLESKSSYAGAAWPATWTPPAPFTTSAPVPRSSKPASTGAAHTEEPTTVGLQPGGTMRVGPPRQFDS